LPSDCVRIPVPVVVVVVANRAPSGPPDQVQRCRTTPVRRADT